MPALTSPLFDHEEPFTTTTGYAGEEDTTYAEGEEDPSTTAPDGEEDLTFGLLVENPFGAY